MDLKKSLVQAAIATVLGGTAFGVGIPPANADPDWQPCCEWRDNGRDRGWHDNNWRDNNWQWRDNNNWDDWWRVHKWRNDDHPPWGWGPPPAVHWRGHPPHVYDYWGYRVHPIWHPGFHGWGFWLFGIFVPVIVIW